MGSSIVSTINGAREIDMGRSWWRDSDGVMKQAVDWVIFKIVLIYGDRNDAKAETSFRDNLKNNQKLTKGFVGVKVLVQASNHLTNPRLILINISFLVTRLKQFP